MAKWGDGASLHFSAMDYVRGALANAVAEGLSLEDVAEMARHAQSPKSFDRAVNELVRAMNG